MTKLYLVQIALGRRHPDGSKVTWTIFRTTSSETLNSCKKFLKSETNMKDPVSADVLVTWVDGLLVYIQQVYGNLFL